VSPTRAILLLILPGLVLCTGCASYNDKMAGVLSLYDAGNFDAAANEMTSGKFESELNGRRDGLLFRLEAAKMLQDAGRFEESNAMFERARSLAVEFDYQADVSVTEEVATVITDQTWKTYRGTEYDRILLEVYSALNYLALNDLEEALVHMRKAYVRQAEAVSRNSSEIADAEEDAAESKGVDSQAVLDDPGYANAQARLDTLVSPAYADYVNPLANFLSAILLREDGDNSNALVDLRKVTGMMPKNHYLPALLEEFEASPNPAEDRLYVIFENGTAPEREEFRLNLYTPQQGVSTFAIPGLAPHPTQIRSLLVEPLGGSGAIETEHVASVDSIVATDFQAQLPGIVIRTIIATVAKEVVTHQVDKASSNDLGFVVANIWKVATSQTDLRTWLTLGAEFQIAYCTVPPDGRVRLALVDHGGGQQLATTVQLSRARTTVLLVRNPTIVPIQPHVFPIGSVEPREPTLETELIPDA